MAGTRGCTGLGPSSLAEGPSLDGIISAHLSQPPTKTGSTGTRCSTFLPLSSPDCSAQGDAIRLHRLHSSLPRPCQAPTPPGSWGAGEVGLSGEYRPGSHSCETHKTTLTSAWSFRANPGGFPRL